MTAVVDEVRLAQAGDRAAFGRLIQRFQDLAFGYALGWLGDADRARDAAQDAFVTAYLMLPQLREPAAFPGWFRRVLLKHCDREARRSPLELDRPDDLRTPDEQLFDHEEREWLRGAVEKLPEHERIVVALHYFGDEPQQDVADFLELPLSTVKKRLFSARRRLEARRADMEMNRPSKVSGFADKVQLFLAIRSSDTSAVSAILDRAPSLLEAKEMWTLEEALQGRLPMQHTVTPLLLASSRGDLPTVKLLLSRGAKVDFPGGRHSGETALFCAALHGYTDVVTALLAAGADPNARNAVGLRPLHAAALHHHDEVMSILEGAGGRPELTTPTGLSALDYCGQQRRGALIESGRFVTGIRAIDLFAPLAVPMVVRVRGACGTGLMVLLAELSRRIGDSGRRSTWVTWEPLPWQKDELTCFAREMGVEDCTSVAAHGFAELGERERESFALFVFRQEGHAAEVDAALADLVRHPGLVFVIDPWAEVSRGDSDEAELTAPFGALIQTSPELGAVAIFPAIDGQRTRSNVEPGSEHHRIADQVRQQLRAEGEHAGALRSLIAQPFATWQHHNGRPGEFSTLAETLAAFQGAL